MINADNLTVCDVTKIALEDNVCLLPGYIEVRGGKVLQHFSDDPNNNIPMYITNERGEAVKPNPDYKHGELKNRKEFRRVEEIGDADAFFPVDQTFHFHDIDVMDKYLAFHKGAQSEVAKQEVVDNTQLPHCNSCNNGNPAGEHDFMSFEHPYEKPVEEGTLPEPAPTQEEVIEHNEQVASEVLDTAPEVVDNSVDNNTPAVDNENGNNPLPVDVPVSEQIDQQPEALNDTPQEVDAVEQAPQTLSEPVNPSPQENIQEETPSENTPEENRQSTVVFALDKDGVMRCSACNASVNDVLVFERLDVHVAKHL